jgi:pimeloyl-ACP methyl ester carboxylesterase
MDFFSKHGSIYAVDMLGHGDSEPGAKDDIQKVSPDEQVRALETLINEEKQKNSDTKFVLVGRSYGGTVVCKLAKNLSPAQIKGLILIAPAASRDVVNELPKDAYPVLLVWARDDPILPFSHSEYFNHFERLQTCFFDNIVTEEIKQKGEQWRGHSSENERPEEFHKKVEEFLQ